MDTTLISPEIPAGTKDKVTVTLSHRYQIEYYWSYDYGQPYYRLNGGPWTMLGLPFYDQNPAYPAYDDDILYISGLNPGDLIQLGFNFHSDDWMELTGWDITNLSLIDNEPPDIQGIYGPHGVDTLGPWTYSTVATDLDGISSYMWSVEPDAAVPIYDDPGDGMGGIDVSFPADGNYDIWVKATDAGYPPLSSEFGPYGVTVFSTNPDAFFSMDFSVDTGEWTYTGGVADGSYQDFWHVDTAQEWLTNVGPDGCYAEDSMPPIPKSASIKVTFPNSGTETRMKIIHQLWVDWGGLPAQPWDGQWVTIDGNVVDPSYGFLYDDNGGNWPHGYFVGMTSGLVVSTFVLGTTYNDGLQHTLTFHSESYDTAANCAPLEGWQIDYLELWLND
jgi:hypothetical protein